MEYNLPKSKGKTEAFSDEWIYLHSLKETVS